MCTHFWCSMRYPITVDEAELRCLIEHHARHISLGMTDGMLSKTGDRIAELAELLCGRRVVDTARPVDLLGRDMAAED